MRWDASRPVPWQRLTKEWVIYAAIMVGVFLVLFRDDNPLGLIAGVLVSGPLYLVIGYVLAKFGYQRKTLKEMRTPRAEPATAKAETTAAAVQSATRPRPAPTRRTSTGPSNRPSSTKRKRKR